MSELAIHGGPKVRPSPMPRRRAFGPEERRMAEEVMDYYQAEEIDLGYEGVYEQRYCNDFAAFQGGGYADSVATGSASCFVAIAALELPKGSDVIISPITDAGPLNSIIMQNLRPVLADSQPDSYNMGPEEFLARITPQTSALFLVHCIGEPTDVSTLVELAHARGIKVIEDASQAHGALHKGRRVGTYGDIAAFSTMFKKNHISGSSGGIVYTTDQDLHRNALAHADRGKPRWLTEFDDRSPRTNLFPAMNWNTDEISCGVGIASLSRLQDTIEKRLAFVAAVDRMIREHSEVCRPYGWTPEFSPFIYPIFVDESAIRCDKQTFAEAVRAEGIDLNPHYGFLVRDWKWAHPYLSDDFDTPNARSARDRSFCLYLNERYGMQEAEDTLQAILKVERFYAR